jgi:hypothetical protein
MANARKTIKVSELVARANVALEATPDEWTREREAIASFVSMILLDTGNYKGFSYQQSVLDADTGRLRDEFDNTRRFYHGSEV